MTKRKTTSNGNGTHDVDALKQPVAPVPEPGLPAATPEAPAAPQESLVRAALTHWGDIAKTPYGVLPVILVCLFYLVSVLQAATFSIAAPNIAQDLELDIRFIGAIFGIIGTISIIATLLVAWLSDRFPRRPILIASSLIGGIMGIFESAAGSPNAFATPATGLTVAMEVAPVPQTSLVADYYPLEARGRVYAATGTFQIMGAVASTAFIGFLVARFGWREAVIFTSAPLFVVALGFLFVKEPIRGYFERRAMGLDEEAARREDPPQSFGEAFRTTWSVRTVRRLFFADLLIGVAAIPFGLFIGFLLADVYGLDPLARGLVFLPAGIAALIGGVLGGGLVDSFSRRAPNSMLRVIGSFIFISLVGLSGIAFTPPLPVLVGLVCVVQFGLALSGPGLNAIYSQVIPPAVRTQGLWVNNLARIPSFLVIGLFTTVMVNYGFNATFAIAVPFLLAGGLVMISAADFFEGDRRNAVLASAAAEESRRLKAEGRARLLICRGVNVFYEGNQVLFGVDFDVEEGEIVALLGTNGAGKSTLLRAISGTQEAADGAIVLDGRDITHMPPHEVTGRGVVHMPGGKGVFPGLSVDENLRLGTWLVDGAHVQRLLDEAYELFPVLRKRRDAPAGALSGGEQQMVALAQAFMAKPRLLMIDELSLGLSPIVVAELLEKVKELNRRGTTVIVVEQSVNVALTLAQRAIFMEKGEVKFVGPTADLLRRPDILRAVYVKGTGALTTGSGSSAPAASRAPRAAGPGANNILDVQQVSKRFGGILALDHVDLKLRENEILGIVGPNGSGKTTLFDIISGYQASDEGRIYFGGQDISQLGPDQRARLKLIRRFQDARLFPSMTVFESLLVALDQKMEVKNAALSVLQLPAARKAERTARRRADRLVELLELGAYRDKFVKELSTGLRRIVDLAFVLATEPRVLLLDEPSSGMAQAEAESLGPLLSRVRHETGCSILMIEHDMPLISAVSDELVALVNGAVLARGTAEEVLNDPRLVEAFLGGSESAIQRSGALV